jgi:outer membrane protein assembly factor BamB
VVPTRARRRRPSRRSIGRLLATLLLGLAWAGGSAAVHGQDAGATPGDVDLPVPTDLAAMTLRSSDLDDLGLPGLGDLRLFTSGGPWSYLASGAMVLPQAIEVSPVASTPSSALGELYRRLEAAGWLRQYRGLLGTTGPDGAFGEVAVAVSSSVAEYASEDGASAAFGLLRAADDLPNVTPLEGVAEIGDESAAYRDTSNLLDLQGDRQTLIFRLGRFIAAVEILADGPPVTDIATLERLGRRFKERITDVRASDEVGVAHLALALDVAVPFNSHRYDLLRGDVLALYAETPEQRASREAGFVGRTDVLSLDQPIPREDLPLSEVPRYSTTVSRFEDEEAATAWLADVPTRRQLEPLADAMGFGDESLTFAEERQEEGVTRRGFRVYVRVGSVIAAPRLDGPDAPALETVEALASIQTRCLEVGACPAPAPVPAPLIDQVCRKEPIVSAVPAVPSTGAMPMAGGDPARTGVQQGPGPQAEPRPLWRFETAGNLRAEPVVGEGALVIGSGDGLRGGADGNLYALHAATGLRLWCVPTGGVMLGAQAIADDLVVGGRGDPRVAGGAVVAVEAATGTERWRAFTGALPGDAIVADESVVVGAGEVLTLDLRTGDVLWSYRIPGDEEALVSDIARSGDRVYAGFHGGVAPTIVALDAATGAEVWRSEQADAARFLRGGPTLAGDALFVTIGNALHALDAADGEERWRTTPRIEAWGGSDEGRLNEPAVADGIVYLGSGSSSDEIEGDSFLFALDAVSGAEVWRVATPAPVVVRPAVVDGIVYAGDEAGFVHAVDREGRELWRTRAGDRVTSTPAVVGGTLFVPSGDGSIQAMR